MTTHKFEHPLNEKTRIYLRIEALLHQLKESSNFTHEADYQLFFRALFDLLDIFEQIQLRSELAKDLEKQRLTYRSWIGVDGVDQSTLDALLEDIDRVYANLMNSDRFGVSLKEDRFLTSIRQRFNLPGGSCCFDLPALHFWLNLPTAQKQFDAKNWFSSLIPLEKALFLWLRLARETGHYRHHTAHQGFYQSDADDANLLRLLIPLHYGAYPMISGHKNRFAIKFIDFETGKASEQEIEFELAVCS